jgi:capsular exopolysaccharide synthesis family protein
MPANNHYHNNQSSAGRHDAAYSSRTHQDEPKEDELNLKKFFLALWRQKWLVIGSIIFFGIIAGIITFTTTPFYQSKGSILIYQTQSGFPDLGLGNNQLSSLLSNNAGIGLGSTVGNELQVLRSRRLSLNIADSLLEDPLMSNGHKYPIVYRSYPDDPHVTSKDTVANRLSNRLTFQKAGDNSDVIDVLYEGPSSFGSQQIVDITLSLFNKLSSRQNRLSANSAASFLHDEKKRVRDSLKIAEENLRQYMDQHKLVQIDEQTKQLIRQMADLSKNLEKARAKLVAANSGIKQYKNELNSIQPDLAEQYSNAIRPDITKLQYAKSELEIKKQRLLAENPELNNNSSQIKKLNQQIGYYKKQIMKLMHNLTNKNNGYIGLVSGNGNVVQTITTINQKLIELQVQKKQYQSKVDVISSKLKEQKKFFDNLPDNIVAFARLKRDVKINSELYSTLSKQYARTSIQERSQFGLGRIIDNGHSAGQPVKPNKPLYIVFGLIFGGVLSAGYIFVRMTFIPTIWGADKIKKLNIPLLSAIPAMDSYIREHYDGDDITQFRGKNISTRLITLLNPESFISTSFHRLEDHLINARDEQEMNSFVLTSSAGDEGRTVAIANLGVVLAEAGYDVVLADADFRQPKLHKLFGGSNSAGMTDILSKNSQWQEVLQETSAANLSLLAAGSPPANVAATMRSKLFTDLLAKLEKQYDFVLINTPPFGDVADSAPLLKHSGGTIIAARCGETTETELEQTCENIEQTGANILGAVLTGYVYHKSTDTYPAYR